MSRNGSGSYTLPAAVNPVVDATTITITWANTTLDDIATALTDSLDRNGKGGMLAPLRCADGSVAAPAYSFTSDTDTGFYRIGANNVGLAIGGSKVLDINGTTLALTGAATVSSTLQVTGDTTLSGAAHIVGAVTADSTIASKKISATGAAGVEGAELANGTAATAATPQNALVLSNGHLALSATDPNSNVGLDNVLVAGLVCKAWANISISAAAAVTLNDGMNISSDTPPAINGGGQLDITLKTGMGNTTYAPVVLPIGLVSWFPAGILSSATVVGVRAYEASGAGAAISWNDGTARQFVIAIFGRQ